MKFMYTDTVLRSFIDTMYTRRFDFRLDNTTTVAELSQLFELCDKFRTLPEQAKAITRALREMLAAGGEPKLDPWEAFKLAAQQEYVALARVAATKLREEQGKHHILKLAETSPSFFEGIPPKFVYALLRYAYRVRTNWHGQGEPFDVE